MAKLDKSKMELVSDDDIRDGGSKLIQWAKDQGWTCGLFYMVCLKLSEWLASEGVAKVGDEWIGVN